MTTVRGKSKDKALRRKGTRLGVRTLAIGSGAVLLAGCQFGGLNSLNMPGTAGHGPGSFKITVQLPDVATLPQNSPVMIDDVTRESRAEIGKEVRRVDAVQHGPADPVAGHDVFGQRFSADRVRDRTQVGPGAVELGCVKGQLGGLGCSVRTAVAELVGREGVPGEQLVPGRQRGMDDHRATPRSRRAVARARGRRRWVVPGRR